MKTFLAGYLTFLNAIAATLGTIFVMGMTKQSLDTGHVDTALISAGVWFAFLPFLICSTIMCGQLFSELMRKPRSLD